MYFYHGGNSIIKIPDLRLSREDLDFGKGFYLSNDLNFVSKWACRYVSAVINVYKLDLSDLMVYKFELDKEWLDFVIHNKEMDDSFSVFDQFDVLIGPMADGRLRLIIEMYQTGFFSAEKTLEIMKCINYEEQIVLKNTKAIRSLSYISHVRLSTKKRNDYKKSYIEEYRCKPFDNFTINTLMKNIRYS